MLIGVPLTGVPLISTTPFVILYENGMIVYVYKVFIATESL